MIHPGSNRILLVAIFGWFAAVTNSYLKIEVNLHVEITFGTE